MPGEREQRKHQGKGPLSLSLSRQGRGNGEDAGGRAGVGVIRGEGTEEDANSAA
ncbi:MAG TPA: hypothetical protein GX744_09125 [Firmicutes bacterium]|nr:hypothetical protein [Bacillota bacterium]